MPAAASTACAALIVPSLWTEPPSRAARVPAVIVPLFWTLPAPRSASLVNRIAVSLPLT